MPASHSDSFSSPGWRQRISGALKSEEGKKQGQKFGLGVSLATAVMTALAMYRGHMDRAQTLQVISALLLALAVLVPRVLYPVAWALEKAFKTVTTGLMHVLLVLVFFLVFSPVGIVLRVLGRDILMRKIQPGADTYWGVRKPPDDKRVEKQF